MQTLFIGEDNLIELVDPENADDGTDLVGATVTFDVKTAADVAIVTGVSMPWVNANRNGRPAYQGVFVKASSATLTDGTTYYVYVNVNSKQGWRKIGCTARYHGSE